jgi:restriction system protein
MARRRRKKPSNAVGWLVLLLLLGAAIKWWYFSLPIGVVLAAGALLIRNRRRRVPRIDVQSLGQLLALSPTGFELAVATLFRDRGFKALDRVGGAGDLTIDLRGRDEKGLTTAIQCKRYKPSNKVGSPDLQRFIGMARTHHGFQRAIVVTTSSYTAQARQLAETHKIELIDGVGLSQMVAKQRLLHPLPPVVAAELPDKELQAANETPARGHLIKTYPPAETEQPRLGTSGSGYRQTQADEIKRRLKLD